MRAYARAYSTYAWVAVRCGYGGIGGIGGIGGMGTGMGCETVQRAQARARHFLRVIW